MGNQVTLWDWRDKFLYLLSYETNINSWLLAGVFGQPDYLPSAIGMFNN
jgi:hypothetical protein